MSAEFLPWAGVVLVAGAVAVTWAARLAPSAGTKGTAGFSEMPPGGRFLVCAGPQCAGVLLHVPVGGGWECTRCASVTGGGS